jgi:hypothetical protein
MEKYDAVSDLEASSGKNLEELLKMGITDISSNNHIDDSYIDSVPKLSILIPNEVEGGESFKLDKGDNIESNPPTPNSIDPVLPFSKEWLYVTSNLDKTVYFMPPKTSGDARKIWRYAKIPAWSFIRDIEIQLIDWAYTYANLYIEDRQIKKITWMTQSNSKCSSTWPAFIKWIICAGIPS